MQSKITVLNHQRISYINHITDPKKPVYVFFHGWMSSKESFYKLFSQVENCIAFDFPGMGQSQSLSRHWTLQDFAEVTSQFLQKYCSDTSLEYRLVAHSFGGRVTLKMMDEQLWMPQWQEVIFTGVPFYRQKNLKVQVFTRLGRMLKIPVFSWVQPALQKVYQTLFSQDDYANLGKSTVLKKTFQNIVEECPSEYLHHLNHQKNIKLIWGANDNSAAPYADAQKVSEVFSHVPLYTVENAGHFPWVDNEKEFIKFWMK